MTKRSKVLLLYMIFIILFNSGYIVYAQNDIALPSGLPKLDLPLAIETYITEHNETTAGVAISIFNDKETFYRGYHGYKDIENQDPISEDTVFEWGSSSKILVWVSILQLWEQGKIDLNQDIRNYLPESLLTKTNNDEKITMLNLMHHNGGWQETIVDLFVEDIDKVQDLKRSLQKTEPAQIYPVGKITAYSNWGTGLAAYIVEEISGQKFYEYIHDNVFIPLDMKNTGLLPDLSDNLWVQQKRKEIQGYKYDNKIIKKNFYHIPIYPAGMVTGTLEDFEKFGKGLIGHSESQKLFQNQDTAIKLFNPTLYYGNTEHARNSNGLWFMEYGIPVLGHGGNTEAFSSNLLIDPISKTTVLVMTNQRYEEVYNDEMMTIIFGEFIPNTPSEPLPKRRDLVGIYQSGRTISKGFGKLYSLLTRIQIKDKRSHDGLTLTWPGKSYKLYEFEPSLYNIEGSLFHIHDDDKFIILSTAYGDYYKLDRIQAIKDYTLLILALIALCYSLVMLILKFIGFFRSKNRKSLMINTSLERYNLFILINIFLVFINILLMAVKLLNYSVLESIIPHVYLSLAFMVILLGSIALIPFVLKKSNMRKRIKIEYIITGISGLIISLNIFYWQLYLLK